MILHTIGCIDQIMQQPDSLEYGYRQSHNSYIQGVNLDGKFTISRLISTDPKLYLDARYAPGQQLPEG